SKQKQPEQKQPDPCSRNYYRSDTGLRFCPAAKGCRSTSSAHPPTCSGCSIQGSASDNKPEAIATCLDCTAKAGRFIEMIGSAASSFRRANFDEPTRLELDEISPVSPQSQLSN